MSEERKCKSRFVLLAKLKLKESPGVRFFQLILAALLAAGFYEIGMAMYHGGFTKAIPILGYVVGSMITLVATILKIRDILAGNAESEFLMAMPIGNLNQVLLMFLRLYIGNTILVALTNIPMIVVYGLHTDIGSGFWPLWIYGMFLTSLPVSGVASLLGAVFALILAPVKRGNLIHSIISLVVITFVGIVVLNTCNGFVGVLMEGKDADVLIRVISKNYRISGMYQNGIVAGQTGWIMLYTLMSLIWNLFFVFVIGVGYEEIMTALSAPKEHRAHFFEKQHQESISRTIWKKQMGQWVNSKVYMTASLLGIIIGILFCILMGQHSSEEISQVLGGMNMYRRLCMATPWLLSLFTAMGTMTYATESLDGKYHWILETVPLDEEFLSRIRLQMHLVMTIPAAVIFGIACILIMKPGVFLGMMYVLMPVLWSVATGFWGLWISRRHADYSRDSENQIMWQSTCFYRGWIPGVAIPAIVAVGVMLI